MAIHSKVEEALIILEQYPWGESQPAATVVMPPDSEEFIIGNESGFVRLAIAALQAAQGEEQRFEKQEWVVAEDYDWGVRGFKPDEYAHLYLPEKLTKWQRVRQSIIGLTVLAVVLAIMLAGLISIGTWLGQLFKHIANG